MQAKRISTWKKEYKMGVLFFVEKFGKDILAHWQKRNTDNKVTQKIFPDICFIIVCDFALPVE